MRKPVPRLLRRDASRAAAVQVGRNPVAYLLADDGETPEALAAAFPGLPVWVWRFVEVLGVETWVRLPD